MKNQITQFSFVIIAFVALTFLMGYTRPAAEEPKQYINIKIACPTANTEKFEEEINKKLAEGWHLQGGVSVYTGWHVPAMVK